MSQTFTLRGQFEIDGALFTELLSLHFFEGHSLGFSDANHKGIGGRRTLHFYPLNRYMFRSSFSEVLKSGISYSVSGTIVGSYINGPLGYPGDGEYDNRPIKQFDVVSSYTRDLLTVRIEGTTEQGRSGFYDYGEHYRIPLPACQFAVVFFVPRVEMQAFFDLTDQQFPLFEKLLDDCYPSEA